MGLLVLASCSGEISEKIAGKQFAFGKAGKLAVLVDDNIWDRHPGDTMRYYYGSAYPILPQPEPLFDLQPHSFDALIQEPILKQLRSYLVLANMSDKESDITKMVLDDMTQSTINSGYGDKTYQLKVGKNKWAENQLVLYIIGKNESGLIDGIKASLPAYTKRLYDFDKIQYHANLFGGGHNEAIENKIAEYYGINMPIPDRYLISIDKPPFLWIQHNSTKVTNSYVFYKKPYQDRSIFTEEKMIELRDSLTRLNISSTTPNSYMVVNDVDLPTFHYTREINGQYASELRGIWDMKNEFMGGAFATFLIHNPKRDEVVFVDAFVFGPGQSKREYMKQLIYLVEEIKILD
jgi:hypothetical protein